MVTTRSERVSEVRHVCLGRASSLQRWFVALANPPPSNLSFPGDRARLFSGGGGWGRANEVSEGRARLPWQCVSAKVVRRPWQTFGPFPPANSASMNSRTPPPPSFCSSCRSFARQRSCLWLGALSRRAPLGALYQTPLQQAHSGPLVNPESREGGGPAGGQGVRVEEGLASEPTTATPPS